MSDTAKAFLCFLGSLGIETVAIVSKDPWWWVVYAPFYGLFLYFIIKKKPNLRHIAWAIADRRAYITFDETGAVWRWPVERGNIPRLWWRSQKWRDKYIVLPTIRERLRWPEFKKLTPGVMPKEWHALQKVNEGE